MFRIDNVVSTIPVAGIGERNLLDGSIEKWNKLQTFQLADYTIVP